MHGSCHSHEFLTFFPPPQLAWIESFIDSLLFCSFFSFSKETNKKFKKSFSLIQKMYGKLAHGFIAQLMSSGRYFDRSMRFSNPTSNPGATGPNLFTSTSTAEPRQHERELTPSGGGQFDNFRSRRKKKKKWQNPFREEIRAID